MTKTATIRQAEDFARDGYTVSIFEKGGDYTYALSSMTRDAFSLAGWTLIDTIHPEEKK